MFKYYCKLFLNNYSSLAENIILNNIIQGSFNILFYFSKYRLSIFLLYFIKKKRHVNKEDIYQKNFKINNIFSNKGK
jgi:hypothetical protein